MPDDKKNLPLSAEISAEISGASSHDEITAALDKAREVAAPPVVAAPVAVEPPKLFTDTFIIGGKEIEISGPDASDVLRQFKAAVQGHELGRSAQPAAPAPPAPIVKTQEELQAEKFELESNFRLGKISADEYLEKSGAVDSYFAKRGIDPSEIKEALQERKGARVVQSWEKATEDFKTKFSESGTAWPGGPRVLDLMGKTLIELNLADKPSADSFQKAYDHLTSKGWDLVRIGQEDAAAVEAAKQPEAQRETAPVVSSQPAPHSPAPLVPKKKLAASGLFNVSGDAGAKGLARPGEVPKIDPSDTPTEILEKWKAANLAAGRNPDDALRETYGVSRVQ